MMMIIDEQVVYEQTWNPSWDAQTFWDFGIQMNHLILARGPELMILNQKKKKERRKKMKKRSSRKVDFVVPADHRIELKESVKRDRYLDLDRKLKKDMKVKVIVSGALGTNPQRIGKGTRIYRNQTTSKDHSDYNIIMIPEIWWDLQSLKLQWETIS